jgi:hypothetical protein
MVVVDVLVVVVGLVVPDVDVATGLLDPPGIGCGVAAGGAFGLWTFTHRRTRA